MLPRPDGQTVKLVQNLIYSMAGPAAPSGRTAGPHRLEPVKPVFLLGAGGVAAGIAPFALHARGVAISFLREYGVAAGLPAREALRVARQVVQRPLDRFEAAMQMRRVEGIIGRRRRRIRLSLLLE